MLFLSLLFCMLLLLLVVVVVLLLCCFVVVLLLFCCCCCFKERLSIHKAIRNLYHFQGQYRRLFKRQTHNLQTLSTLPRTHMTSRSHGKHLPRTYEGLAEVNSGFQRPLHDDSDSGDTGSIIHRRNQCLLRASSLSSVNTDCWFQVTQIVVQEMKNDLRRRGRVALRDLG